MRNNKKIKLTITVLLTAMCSLLTLPAGANESSEPIVQPGVTTPIINQADSEITKKAEKSLPIPSMDPTSLPPVKAKEKVKINSEAENNELLLNSLNKEIEVFIATDGKGFTSKTHPGTLKNILNNLKIEIGEYDKTSAPIDSLVNDGQLIIIERGNKEVEEKKFPIEYKKINWKTPVECDNENDTTKITREGKNGERTETWERITLEKELIKETKTKDEITIEPIDQVTQPCLIPEPEPEPIIEPEPEPIIEEKSKEEKRNNIPKTSSKEIKTKKTETVKKESKKTTETEPKKTTKKTKVTGSKADWMRAAGIPESQWKYVDYIVSKESGWNPNAVNPSSGACSLVQSLPCSKIGPNWRDPVVALKWQHNYVKSRYGGYEGAYNFWIKNRWY